MGGKRDSAGRNKEIARIRKRMARKLDLYGVFADISPELNKRLNEATEYSDFRRVENERQLEAIKSVLAGYIFNENVVVQAVVPDKNGIRVVAIDHFEAMQRATNLFLAAMNMQNKMWGLYSVEQGGGGGAGGGDSNTLTAKLVHEIQRIAQQGRTRMLPPVTAKIVENGK
jgi:hypothetical protein